ncbi:MAG: hypothetical protein WA208_12640 [Thermoanaerobaculia bacterium]
MPQRPPDEYERAAAGLDYDQNDPIRERAAAMGATMAENGPGALFDEIENLLPEMWRDQIRTFPIAAVLAGFGIGVWLGMKKSDEVIAAGTAMASAAAMSNVSSVMDKVRGA